MQDAAIDHPLWPERVAADFQFKMAEHARRGTKLDALERAAELKEAMQEVTKTIALTRGETPICRGTLSLRHHLRLSDSSRALRRA